MTKEAFGKFDLEHIVCECFDVTLAEIIEAIKEGHASTDALMDKLDVGSACELCQCKANDEDGDRELHLDEILKHIQG
jgi:bacterioferritin-associated ferredoxin